MCLFDHCYKFTMNASSQENDFVILQIVRYRLRNRLFYTSDLFFRGRFQHEVLEIRKTADKITIAGLTKDPKSWEVWLFASGRKIDNPKLDRSKGCVAFTTTRR